MYIRSISSKQYRSVLTHFKFIAGMDIGETRRPQDGAIHNYNDAYDLRLSTLPTGSTESLAIRILPHKLRFSLENSVLFNYQLKQIEKLIHRAKGILLVSGPTGSGKSSFLYNLIQQIVTTSDNQIITIEDPIEQDIANTIQIQVNQRINLTYESSLVAALRHDPDIIMIGEIRDAETAFYAFEAALTGHLVLSTIHAKNAAGTIQRLLEMGLSETDLRQTLLGIATTELIRLNHTKQKRAAIFELLTDKPLLETIEMAGLNDPRIQTFSHLRKKAYAYGFTNKKNFE